MLNFERLDDEQRKAVTAPDGIVRIMAGAGTGKTTTLESRVAYLIQNSIAKSYEIMAVTFTNKAAKEIKERVSSSVGSESANVRMGTFHSLSLRILRKYAVEAGLKNSSFTIIDDTDVKTIFDEALSRSGVMQKFIADQQPLDMTDAVYKQKTKDAEKAYKANRKDFLKDVVETVLRWKENGLSTHDAARDKTRSPLEIDIVSVYESYQEILAQKNMCDFSDLILHVVNLFKKAPQIAETEAKKIRYLLVDEFQDTNMLQYEWLKYLSGYHNNLFVVGDLDQSLYSFRGSAPQIMERLSAHTTVDISLKNNRRCTQEILYPANRLVDLNQRTSPKVLNSEKNGSNVSLKSSENEFGETNMVVSSIKSLIADGSDPDEIAIIARAGYVLKPFEKALLRSGIPYCLTGNGSILDREEVKDIMSFAKLAVDPYNDLAFHRIANKPARGIGPTTVNHIVSCANTNCVSIADACHIVATGSIKGAARKGTLDAISELGKILSSLSRSYELDVIPVEIIDMAYEDSGYKEYIEVSKTDDAKTRKIRKSNIKFMKEYAEGFHSLVEFLQEFSIATDAVDEGDGVRISTIHASKGLEFDHVFLPGWEEGIMPSAMSIKEKPGDIDDPWVGPPVGGIEEERRIAHVALTRARISAHVSRSKSRAGRKNKPSRFINEAGLGSTNKYNPAYDIDFDTPNENSSNEFSDIKFKSPRPKISIRPRFIQQ